MATKNRARPDTTLATATLAGDETPLATLAAAEEAIVAAEPHEIPAQPIAAQQIAAQPASDINPAVASTAIPAKEQTMDMNTATDTTKQAAAQATAQATAMFADAKSRAEDAMGKSARMFEEVGAFTKGNVEALVESTKIAVRGFETLGQDAAEYARKSLESTTAAVKTLAQTKSPTEFMRLQGDFARQSFDAMVAETSRSTESMLKLVGEVVQPISNRVAVAADKMKTAA